MASEFLEDKLPWLAVVGARYGVIMLVIAVAAGGVTGYAVMNPVEEEQTLTSQESVGTVELHTSATLTNDTAAYSKGQTVRDSPLYLRGSMDTMNVTVNTTAGGNGYEITGQKVVLVKETVVGNAVFWKETETLYSGSAQLVGEPVVRSVDLASVASDLEAVDKLAEPKGKTRAQILVETTYMMNGKEQTFTTSLPITVFPKSYSVGGGAVTNSETVAVTETQKTTEEVMWTPFSGAAAGISGVVGLVLLVGGVGARRRLSEVKRQRYEYTEWISEGSVESVSYSSLMWIGSLPDLVDTAIDSGRRVVYDESKDVFVVVTQETTYYWSPTGRVMNAADKE